MAPKARTVICIGDVHGHVSKLDKLWLNLQSSLDPSDFNSALVIFLGDYCDRGPESRKVIDFLISLPEKHPDQRHVFLAGNHDSPSPGLWVFCHVLRMGPSRRIRGVSSRRARREKGGTKVKALRICMSRVGDGLVKTRDQFDSAGVEFIGSVYDAGSTFESYGVPHGSSDLVAVPESHKKFLTNMVWVHEEEDVCIETEEGLKQCKLIAVHAGLDKRKSVNDQLKHLRAKDTSISKIQQLNGRKDVLNMPEELVDKQTIVVSGHHGKLHIDGLRLIIDESGGYDYKPLAAIILPSKKIIRDTDIFSN